MKASEIIKQLEQLIAEHGDLPLAMIELDSVYGKTVFVEADGVEGVYHLTDDDLFYDSNDEKGYPSKVFVID